MLTLILQQRSKSFNVIKRKFNSNVKEFIIENNTKLKTIPSILKFGFGGLGIATICILKSHKFIVECKAIQVSKDNEKPNKQLNFKWKIFFQYLYPYLWQLLIALSVSIYV